MKGMVFDIARFAIHDGPGIRTVIFFKGCPLRCIWCHNPESRKMHPEVFFSPQKCINCGWCEQSCPNHCHQIRNDVHTFDRRNCILCGKCMEKCCIEALALIGREMNSEEIMREILKDKIFYGKSGGVTFSGGEPMAQFEFLLDLCRLSKGAGLHVSLETCGFAPWKLFEKILPYVDLYLYDIKATDDRKHQDFTGESNKLILENLRKLDEAGASITLRCPLVPGVNDDTAHLREIAVLANSLSNVQKIDLHPYHPLGLDKSMRLGEDATLSLKEFTPDMTCSAWIKEIAEYTEIEISLNA